jgi:YidC/Oxa1 family membrane protein insertase
MVEKVPSLKGGGAYWFTDLTTPDEYIILPVLTSLTFLATVEVCILATLIQISYLLF